MSYLRSHAARACRLSALSHYCTSFLLQPRFALLGLALSLAPASKAQSVWNTTTGNWSTSANWSPAALPLNSNETALIFGGSTSYTSTNDLSPFSLNQVLFNNTAGTVTLGGSMLLFENSPQAMLASLTLAGAGSATLTAPITWDGETTVTNAGSGALLFNGGQTFANGTKQTFINAGSGSISLADGNTYSAIGSGTGLVLNLVNNNAAAGSFTIGNMPTLANTTLNIGGTGTVSFGGTVSAAMFSTTTTLNVLSGAKFDFNGNAATVGGFSGAGTLAIAGVNLNASGVGAYTFSGKLTGAGGSLTLTGATHTLTLSGSTSDYTGATTINAGRLIVSANAPSGNAGALGSATSEVLMGTTTSTASAASLMIDTAGVSIGRAIRLQTGNSGVLTLGGLNTSGTVTYSGNVTMGSNSAAGKAVALYAAAGGTVEFTGNLLRATGASGTSDSMTIAGGGTVALRGGNTFTGGTAVTAGLLLLDFSSSNTSKLSATASLNLNGGSLSVLGNSGTSSTQTVGALNLGNSSGVFGGAARITVTSGTNQNTTLALKVITRNKGATVDFNPTGTGSGVGIITTTTANNSAGILGGYATYKLDDWAVNDGSGNIVALAAGSYTTSFGSGLHTSLTDSTVLVASGGSVTNTLRLMGTSSVIFSAAGDTLTLESGGILVASTAGTTSIGASGTAGILSSSSNELIIHQQSTVGTLTINSVIAGSTGITKSGDGTLVLAGTNTYTGGTFLNGGTLSVTAAANLGNVSSALTIDGGTLLVASGSLGTIGTSGSTTGRTITIGTAGATFNFGVGVSFNGAGLVGTGTITKTGVGVWGVGANASSFTGSIILNDGALSLTSSQLKNVAGITVNSGASYIINDDGVGTFNIATAARFIINGNGLGSNGAIRLTDQTGGSAFVDPLSTITNDIVLQTSSRVQVDNGSAAGSLSQLIFAGSVTGAGSLDKTGNGVLTLTSRDNTYAGSTFVENGTLRIDLGNDRLPTGTSVTLGNSGNSGVLQLNGYSQTLAGLTTVGSGTANSVIGGSATSTSLLDVNLASGSQTYSGILGGTGVNNTNAGNNLGFIKDGAGTFTISGANTYNGGTTVNQGTLVLGNASALGSSGVSLSADTAGTTVNAGATLDLNGQTNVQEVINLNGTGVSGAGALVNNSATAASIGSGVASLSFSSVTTTGWSANAAVSLAAPGSGTSAVASAKLGLSSSSIALTSGGSGFGLAPTVTVNGGSGAVIIASVGVTSASYAVTAWSTGTMIYSVAPTVTLSNGATGVANLDGAGKVISITVTNAGSGFTGTPTATFSGGTATSGTTAPTATGSTSKFTIVGLTLVNGGTGFTSVPTITITGGTGATATVSDGNFVLNGVALTNSGSGYTTAPAASISGGSATATANVTTVNLESDSSVGGSGNLTINAVVTGNAGLTKVGTGTTTLAGNNTYTGTTTVSAGTLQVGVAGAGQSGAGALTVNGSGAVLAGTGSIQGATAIILGTLKPGDNGGAGTGTLNTHDLSFVPVASTTVAELQITGSTAAGTLASDKINIAGTLTLNSSSNILVNGSGYTAKVGDTFTLIDWSGLLTTNGFSTGTNLRTGANGAGNEGNLDLPDITGIGLWQIGNLLNGGDLTLTVVANVPEPTRGVLLLGGMVMVALRRRRRK